MHWRWHRIIAGLVLAAATAASARAAESPVFDIPRLPNIAIDGKADDWGERGFQVDVIQSLEGKVKPVTDLDVRFRLGWDARGLLVLVAVRDDVAYEKNNYLWENDSIELFVAAKRGASEAYQVVLTPGREGEKKEPRRYVDDHRSTPPKQDPVAAEVARTWTAGSYTMEVLLPWKNLARPPGTGEEIGFQLYVNDADGAGSHLQVIWYPKNRAHENSSRMHRLRLAERASPPVRAAATGSYERLRRVRVRVNGAADTAGKSVEVRDGRRTVARGRLAPDQGRSTASLALPMPGRGASRADRPRGWPAGGRSGAAFRRPAASARPPGCGGALPAVRLPALPSRPSSSPSLLSPRT
jgi:hypothetical protein